MAEEIKTTPAPEGQTLEPPAPEVSEAPPAPEPGAQGVIPGMRYCQAQALVHSLMRDGLIQTLSEREKDMVTGRILEEVRGRMLEDIVLLETAKSLDSRHVPQAAGIRYASCNSRPGSLIC